MTSSAAVTTTAVAAPGRGADRRPKLAARWIVGLLLLAAVLRIPAFFVEEFNSDETFLATQANVVLDGGRLYQEAADRKPPIVPYLYATAFALTGSRSLWSIRMLAAVCVGLTALLIASEARRRWSTRAGLIAAVLFVFATVSFAPQDGQAANFEVFMLAPMTLAVVLAARRHTLPAGIAAALATLTKQTGAATMLPVLFSAWRARARRGVLEALAGFAVPLVLAALAFGAGDFVYWILLGNGSYLDVGRSVWYVLGMLLAMTAGFVLLNLPITVPLWRAWRTRVTADLDLWWWLVSAAVSVLVGLRFFGHYYLQLLPPLSMLAGYVLASCSRRVIAAAVALSAAVAVACVGLSLTVKPFDEPVRYERAAQFIRANTGADDRVLVWGAMPEIYWASGRLPATRILNTHFLDNVWAASRAPNDTASVEPPSPEAWTLFLDDLRARPPKFVVDTSTSGAREASLSPISKYPELARTVAANYHYRTTIDGITIYERN